MEKLAEDFSRPPIPPMRKNDDSIIFQLLDIDCGDKKTIPRLFGVTKDENSICCYVYKFFPYFYVGNCTRQDECTLREYRRNGFIKSVEKCYKNNLYGYRKDGELEEYLKITTFTNYQIWSIKNSLSPECQTFEADVDFPVRFMTDAKIPGGCCWIELPPGSWGWFGSEDASENSRCQINVCAYDWKDLITHKWSDLAPLRILSFDIECAGRPGIFPTPDADPVIQIGNCLTRQNDDGGNVRSVIFTLNSCAPIRGATVVSFTDEADMLRNWADFFVRVVDPDIITGYNINNFDLPFLLNRAKALNIDDSFPYLGRDKRKETVAIDVLSFGRENKRINVEGRCLFDLLPVIMREHKLRSYSLNAVSFHFLGEQKEDVHHSVISTLQNGNDETRKRIAVYCLKDCLLPLKILEKLMLLINYVEMARVAGILLSYVINRGQQIKVFCQILKRAFDRDLILPDAKRKRRNENKGCGGETVVEYEGATVIEPKRGYYNTPVVTLDFASLYPSIMIAHNLCYTTFLPTGPLADMVENRDYIVTPTRDYFVTSRIKKGLLPEILLDLLSSRKKAKADMKNASDFWQKQSYNARQSAIKITANSIYGFTGAQRGGMLPCVEISQSVTSFGRTMIALTKDKIEEYFRGSNVIYGDTDSVMIKFDGEELPLTKAFALGENMARYVTNNFFIDPIKLEFEKIYFPYLLINKKRYAGLYYTNPEAYDKMDCKGIETVRRDNCRLVARVTSTCLEKILIDRNPNDAIQFVKNTISDLLLDKIDISQLVITKELKKSEYKGKQPHAELAKKLRKRAEAGGNGDDRNASAPKLGERVPFVIVRGAKKSRVYENAEDPLYALKHKIPIDFDYYLTNQLCKPLVRIFEPIFGRDAEGMILRGDHVRAKKITTGSTLGLLKFVKLRQTCVGCGLPIVNASSPGLVLCKKCQSRKKNVYENHRDKLEKLATEFEKIKATCVACQKTDNDPRDEKSYDDILCSNSDCPIFYKRKRVQMDVETQRELAEKLAF